MEKRQKDYIESSKILVKKPFLPLPHSTKIAYECFAITSIKQCHFLTARLYNEKVRRLQLQLLFVHIDLLEEVFSNVNLNSLRVFYMKGSL